MELRLSQLSAVPVSRETRESLGLYLGVPLSTSEDVAAALNAALHRLWALRVAPTQSAADSEPEDEDFTVWNETQLTPEMIESALVELRRQDDEKAATERIGVLRGFGGGSYWKDKYEEESQRYWNQFYQRNETRFFKDRHYLDRDFDVIKALIARYSTDKRPIWMLECGCGVGNAFFPLVAKYPCLRVVGIDLSARAVQLIKEHPLFTTGQVQAYVKDAVKDSLVDVASGIDFAVMLFMVSALSPHQMLAAFKHVHETLVDGGVVSVPACVLRVVGWPRDLSSLQLLFRDYGRYDAAQLRFRGKHKLAENLYVRQDGTRAYFFDAADLERLGTEAGFEVLEIRAICRTYVNRKEGVGAPRVWMHARFRKPTGKQ